MKNERILYVILILVALVIGIYGGLSGLFTPHHYYEIDDINDSCESPDGTIYINKRENYLVFSHEKYLQTGKFSILEEKENYIKWEYISEDKDIIVIDIEQTKLNDYFKVDIISSSPWQTLFFQTCSIKKQFLQRN
tara:strand:+ start:169 stop:576 length:408 start_codon:yes stop_codon:yes gene_type:complete